MVTKYAFLVITKGIAIERKGSLRNIKAERYGYTCVFYLQRYDARLAVDSSCGLLWARHKKKYVSTCPLTMYRLSTSWVPGCY